ncbi:hypothetical protein FAIPA1_140056 [Frankia sp. AiPs1]
MGTLHSSSPEITWARIEHLVGDNCPATLSGHRFVVNLGTDCRSATSAG